MHGIGFTGRGATIVIFDKGIDSNHPAFTQGGSRIIAERCFSNSGGNGVGVSLCPNGQPTDTSANVVGVAACLDGADNICDHGTHVAGIAAGKVFSFLNGVAPEANIVAIQVFTRVKTK